MSNDEDEFGCCQRNGCLMYLLPTVFIISMVTASHMGAYDSPWTTMMAVFVSGFLTWLAYKLVSMGYDSAEANRKMQAIEDGKPEEEDDGMLHLSISISSPDSDGGNGDGNGDGGNGQDGGNDASGKNKQQKKEEPPQARLTEGTPGVETLEQALAQLDALTGLDTVKKDVRRLANYIEVQKLRADQGLATTSLSLHCVFTGNPGTGKTTVARIIADIYRALGVISRGHLVETDRAGLIGEFVGQTAVKTNKLVDFALDGVLFIDEAYSLVGAGGVDFGSEAIATLLKRMEDDRDRLVVILAGYTNEMAGFIATNPGLKSRFSRTINFPDYDDAALKEIYLRLAGKYGYELTPEADTTLTEVIAHMTSHRDKNFGNAREIRNLFERTIENQAQRLASLPDTPSKTELSTIHPSDIPNKGVS